MCIRICSAKGQFTGKGIYDVDAFQVATQGRFPENTLLSHDLIEGNYARAGLATDVIVYDDYPATYVAYTRRKHRWIRGDWQLLPWLRRTVPGPDGPERNRLSMVSQWKILDNLRRSTVEIVAAAVPARRLDDPARLCAALDAARPWCHRRTVGDRARAGRGSPAARQVMARVLRGRCAGRGGERRAGCSRDADLAASGADLDRRDRRARCTGCSCRGGTCSNGSRRQLVERSCRRPVA